MTKDREKDIRETRLLAGGGWSRWAMPSVFGEAQAQTPSEPEREPGPEEGHQGLLSQAQIEQIREQARREGFEQGLREGRETGRTEIESLIARWQSLIATLEHPLQQLDREVEEQLMRLAVAIATQLVRHDIDADPQQIIEVVRGAVAAMPASSRKFRVLLHPEDAALIREVAGDEAERSWEIVEDPATSRGGCQVISEASRIDERVETRLQRAVAQLMGEAGARPAGTDFDEDYSSEEHPPEEHPSEERPGEGDRGGRYPDDEDRQP